MRVGGILDADGMKTTAGGHCDQRSRPNPIQDIKAAADGILFGRILVMATQMVRLRKTWAEDAINSKMPQRNAGYHTILMRHRDDHVEPRGIPIIRNGMDAHLDKFLPSGLGMST